MSFTIHFTSHISKLWTLPSQYPAILPAAQGQAVRKFLRGRRVASLRVSVVSLWCRRLTRDARPFSIVAMIALFGEPGGGFGR